MQTIPIIAGPTASGKTALALGLTGRIGPLEVISADSRQVYRRLDIGTGKPTVAERARLPHHLIDIVEPDETYSAGRFRADAEAAIAGCLTRGVIPLVVGGTGFYLRALVEGLSPIPPVPRDVSEEVRRELAAEGLAALYRRLLEVDPTAAAGIGENDPQRTLRALAVWRATGRPLSAWWPEPGAPPAYAYSWVGLAWPRQELRARIAARTDAMIAAGLEREVRGLIAAGYSWDDNATRTVGYREWRPYLDGQASLDDVRRAIVVATGRYAKRQMTWFNAVPAVHWLPGNGPDLLHVAFGWLELLLH